MHGRKHPKDFHLSPSITAEVYLHWQNANPPRRDEIAKMIKRRFESRFLDPIRQDGRVRGGFAAVALCCLAMEALDAFRHGRAESNTADALRHLIKINPEFSPLKGREQKFYENIRNGLLHQGETRGGWRIHISGPVFNPDTKIIGAQALLEAFATALDRYCVEVANSTDDSHVWKLLLTKMGHVLKTCDDEPGS